MTYLLQVKIKKHFNLSATSIQNVYTLVEWEINRSLNNQRNKIHYFLFMLQLTFLQSYRKKNVVIVLIPFFLSISCHVFNAFSYLLQSRIVSIFIIKKSLALLLPYILDNQSNFIKYNILLKGL